MKKGRFGLKSHRPWGFERLIFCLAVALLYSSVGLRAQENGTIVGTVTDQSGAVVPDVTITVTNQATRSVTRTTVTNSDGNYAVAGLPISTYTIRAEKQGFAPSTRTDLVVNVGSDTRVDLSLTLGAMSQEVSVTATAVHLQTENAQVSDTVTGNHIEAIDTNGRNFIQLANLVPGAVGPSLVGSFNTPVGVTANSGINFSGERQAHNVFSVDGQENYDRGCGGCIEIVPDQDAIAEFKVLSSNAGQDLGFGSAAHIQMEIKSGTQAFHGEAFEFNRNKALETQPFFTNLAGLKRPYENYNNFGFNLGGPFGRPGGNHKTFFFATIDWRKLLQATTFSGNGIPANWTTGDFSTSTPGIQNPVILDHSQPGTPCMFNGAPQTCYPIISSGGVNNVIPAVANPGSTYQLDPNALLLAKSGFIFLPPNSGTQAIGGVTAPVDVNEQIIRIDHQFSDRTSLMAHYIRNGIVQVVPRGLWQTSTFPVVATDFLNEPESILLKLTHSISPTLLSESVIGFNRQPLTLLDLGTFSRPSGTTIKDLFPENPENRIPNISISGTPQGVSYTAASWPWYNVLNTWTFRETLTKISGAHTLNFGFEDLHYLKEQLLFGQTQGAFGFDGGATNGYYIDPASGTVKNTTGNSFASFLLGNAQNFSEEQTQFLPAYINNHTGLWLGDDWKVRSGLTLNMGLRWEGMPHAHERHNVGSVFVPSLFDSTLASTVLDANGNLPAYNATTNPYLNGIGIAGKQVPVGFVQNHWALFEPRIGVAYQPHPGGKLVVRGGFGLFYENIQGNDVYNIGSNPPFDSVPQLFNNALETTDLLTNPGGGTAVAKPGNIQSLQPTYPQEYSIQYNFGGEYQFTDRTVFSLSYVGNKSYNQQINENINQPPLSATPYPSPGINSARPYLGWANINQYTNIATANYNSLQASLRTSNWHGLTAGAAYTYSHCLDFVDNDNAGGNSFNYYNLAEEYGNCGFDVRHTLIVNYVYSLPFFNAAKGLTRTMLGGWQVSVVSTFYSGLPYTIGAQGGDIANCGCGGYRANQIGNPNSGSGIHTRLQWFNTAAFAADPAGSFGSAARNTMRGQGINNFDFSVYKNFAGIPLPHSSEGGTLQFRLESYNLFNHTQFNGFATSFGSGNFGQATSARLPRQLQLGLKFSF
jgi:hypothetical protein